MPSNFPESIERQIEKARLPRTGPVPFEPMLTINRRGKPIIEKAEVSYGPKQGKTGYVDSSGRIWVRDREHAEYSDHWDVQIDGGADYLRVDDSGNVI